MKKLFYRTRIEDFAKMKNEILNKEFYQPPVVRRTEKLKCSCCNGTGMLEGESWADFKTCNFCSGKGTF